MSLSPSPRTLHPKRSTPNIRNLQAAFESPNPQDYSHRHPHAIYPPSVHRSNAGDLTPSANVPSTRIASPTKSIDSVLDTPVTPETPSPPNRPLARFRPSWVGPQPSKPMKTDIAGHLESTMKQRVSIELSSPGLQPPVYIFTSLSDPQWTALEMFPVKQMSGDFTFVRGFEVEEGEYQYKFRLGPGDWWVCDEKREVVDDSAGNRNNRIVVKSGEKKAVDSGDASPEPESAASRPASGLMPQPAKYAEPVVAPPSEPVGGTVQSAKVQDKSPSAPGQQPVALAATAGAPASNAETQQHQEASHYQAAPQAHTQKAVPLVFPNSDFESEAEPYTAPLLRHESLCPTSHEQEHSPLFRHESIALGYNHHEGAAPQPTKSETAAKPALPEVVAASAVPREADSNDPSLHHFPSDKEGILKHIERMHTRLPADVTSHDANTFSPASSAAVTDSSFSSLPSVTEDEEDDDDNEQFEKIREAGQQEVRAEQENGTEVDPLREGAVEDDGEATEPEDADFEPKIPELKVLFVPKEEKTTEEMVIIDRRSSMAATMGTRKLMAVAVGLLAVIAAVALVKLFE